MKRFFLIFVFYGLAGQAGDVCAQSVTWEKIYDTPLTIYDGINDICESDSGNFFLAGYSLFHSPTNHYLIVIIKINSLGDTIWKKTYGRNGYKATSIASTNDGGCIITGSTVEAFSIKLDRNGNILWERYYGGYGVQCSKIIKTSDKGYIACGIINLEDGYIFKIDSLGVLQWQKIFPNKYLYFISDIIEQDNYFFITGLKRDNFQDTSKAIFTKLDKDGNLILEKRLKIKNRLTEGLRIISKNNNFIIAGNTIEYNLNNEFPFYCLVDSTGSIIYQKVYPYNGFEIFSDMFIRNNQFVISTSIEDSNLSLNGKVIITDTSGNILKHRIFPTSSFIDFTSSIPLNNGDMIFTSSADFGVVGSEQVGFVVRTDSNLYSKSVDINNGNTELINDFYLYQNYPNPFNPTTKITYSIPVSGNVKIKIFDMTGREIKTLINDFRNTGSYDIEFNGSNLSSGVYFYKLDATGKDGNDFVMTKRMILLK